MSRKSKDKHLLEKSIQASISAIEIYNKPDFKYREESFCILIVNAWETLLKAKIIADNQGRVNSIYKVDHQAKRKDGTNYKKPRYQKNRVGNELTIDIFTCLKKLQLDKTLKKNIELLVLIRNDAIHYYNKCKNFEKKVLEIGTANLKSYVHCIKDWFNYDLSQYNFYLMPISFFHPTEFESHSINKKDKQHQNLLKYIEKKEKENPSDEKKKHNISLVLETKFVRSNKDNQYTLKFIKDPNNPNLSISTNAEDEFENKYRWNYTENLLPKLTKRYLDFKPNNKFWKLKEKLEGDKRFCGIRYLDLTKKKGTKKKFYSPDILKEFDKYYTRK